MDDCVSVTLLRHGITKANEQKKYLGWGDPPLSANGIKHLKTCKEKQYPIPDVLLSSDLQRCVQTASILFPNVPIQTTKLFREYHFGSWDGFRYEDLKTSPEYCGWLVDQKRYSPPNGETFQQFAERIHLGWKQLVELFAKEEVKNITLITHGGPIRLLLMSYTKEKKDFWDWQTPYGCGYRLVGKRDGLRRGECCTLLQEVPLTEN